MDSQPSPTRFQFDVALPTTGSIPAWTEVRSSSSTPSFLVFDDPEPRWSSVEDRIVAFFNEALGALASSDGDSDHPDYEKAVWQPRQ